MRWLPVFMLICGSSVAMAAPDCSFENARYAQADGWMLQFQPVPRDAPANQTASFILGLKSGAKLTGAIMWPNGYSTPLWSVEGPCQPDGDEICRFTEAENNTAYVLAEAGIERMPEQMDGPPARQVLLTQLAATIWYSSHRSLEFDGEPGDVFDFAGCAN
ncbi:hypothetical protein [Devosia sp.]|uniref:hypothetical protein n=1 Tax=Devosia sp. TaxID=1871048 RepID=UPI001AC89D95|nr:hypothetical protein [Devosia sp.]MBN9334490.1 hypothetical protein [Devosia sp.]